MSELENHPHLSEEGRKPKVLLAAGLAGVMLLISLSTAGITAWYLMVGEQGNAVQNTLPSDCEWLVENHEGHSFALLSKVADLPEFAALPHPASAVMARLPKIDAELLAPLRRTSKLPLSEGFGVCGRKGAVLISVPLGDDKEGALDELSALIEGHVGKGKWAVSDEVERFTERTLSREGKRVVSILHTEKHAVVALTEGDHDASKAQAAAVSHNQKSSMRANMAYREGRERVGGTERLWISEQTLKAWAPNWLTEDQIAYIRHTKWLAASLREEDGDVVIHIHLGGGQRLFDHATRHLDQEGDIALKGRKGGLKAKYFVVDKGVIVTARTPLPVVAGDGS